MSQMVRTEEPVMEQSSPLPPDYKALTTPRLEPVPQKSTRAPRLPAPQLIPPPAPPAESAQRTPASSKVSDLDAWESESVELVDQQDAEFFGESAPAYPPAFVTERSASYAARLAEQGQAARQRKETREPLWPVIVPGASTLKPVAEQEPKLMPVPK